MNDPSVRMQAAREVVLDCFREVGVSDVSGKLADELTARFANMMAEAAMFFTNTEFYRGIVYEVGEMFGDAAKTSDDGTVQKDVLALRVPGLVRQLIEETRE